MAMELPVACSLAGDDQAARVQRWRRLAARAFAGRQDIEAGLTLRFRALPGVAAELEQLAAAERDCCAFARWEITRAGEELTLAVTADGEGVAAVREMFGALG
jgi:hypothetical protein